MKSFNSDDEMIDREVDEILKAFGITLTLEEKARLRAGQPAPPMLTRWPSAMPPSRKIEPALYAAVRDRVKKIFELAAAKSQPVRASFQPWRPRN